MGDPKTGSQRLNVGGGVNNFGTTIGPLIVSFAIFGSVANGSTEASIESVKTPYLILGIAFVIVAIFFKFSSVPNKIDLDHVAEEEADSTDKVLHRASAFSYPQLILGMIAIFVYVGVEVSTASNLPEYMKQHMNISTEKIAPFVSLYWASMMIGRWTGAVEAFTDNLMWQNHVSDLKGWQSAAAQVYGVNSIPTNFLIDGKGVILAVGLRGEALQTTLKSLVKGQAAETTETFGLEKKSWWKRLFAKKD